VNDQCTHRISSGTSEVPDIFDVNREHGEHDWEAEVGEEIVGEQTIRKLVTAGVVWVSSRGSDG
jgi:hypothetical protein